MELKEKIWFSPWIRAQPFLKIAISSSIRGSVATIFTIRISLKLLVFGLIGNPFLSGTNTHVIMIDEILRDTVPCTYESQLLISQHCAYQCRGVGRSLSGYISAWMGARKYWMIYRGPRFLAYVWFGSSPILFPTSSVSKLSLFLCPPVCRRSSLLTGGGVGGGGGGGEPKKNPPGKPGRK